MLKSTRYKTEEEEARASCGTHSSSEECVQTQQHTATREPTDSKDNCAINLASSATEATQIYCVHTQQHTATRQPANSEVTHASCAAHVVEACHVHERKTGEEEEEAPFILSVSPVTHVNHIHHTLECKDEEEAAPQHTAPHCNALQHTEMHCDAPRHTAARCNMLQHAATRCNTEKASHECVNVRLPPPPASLSHYNTLQYTATHGGTLQNTSTLQYWITHCNTLQHPATQYDIL